MHTSLSRLNVTQRGRVIKVNYIGDSIQWHGISSLNWEGGVSWVRKCIKYCKKRKQQERKRVRDKDIEQGKRNNRLCMGKKSQVRYV